MNSFNIHGKNELLARGRLIMRAIINLKETQWNSTMPHEII